MPDIEQRVGEWRRAMLARCDGRDDVVDELEAHLWDVVEELSRAGRSPDAALATALTRLGHPDEIGDEFVKVPPARQPWLPVRLAWIAGALLLPVTVLPLAGKFAAGGTPALLAAHVSSVVLGYTAGLIGGALAVSLLLARLVRDPRAGQKESLKRAVLVWSGASVLLTGAGVLLGGWCPHEKTGWCFGLATHEIAGVGVLLWGAVTFAGYRLARRSCRLHRTVLLGVLGNVVVALGWFAAASGGAHSVGALGTAPVLAGLILSQFAVGLTALAPVGWLRAGRS